MPGNPYYFLACHSTGIISNWVLNSPTISTQTGFTTTDACYDLDNNQVLENTAKSYVISAHYSGKLVLWPTDTGSSSPKIELQISEFPLLGIEYLAITVPAF